LFVVADGMGGHNAGEVASALAVTTLKAGARLGIDTTEDFRELVQQANSAIYTASLDDSTQSGMGTTVTALSIVEGEEPRVLVANVGDSRAYLWRSGALSRLSVDHSYVQELVNEGIITPEAARVHPRRNIVTRALGIDRSVMVDVFTHFVRTGDRIVLCSDGLVDEVADVEIARVLGQHTDPQETAEALVMVANTNGGRDNTTVIVVDVLDDISEPIASSAPDNTAPMQSPSVDASDSGPVGAGVGSVAVKKKSRVGMVLFWTALVAIVLSGITVVGVYARSGYFIGFDKDSRVAVYRGRVGGVLWFNPTIDTQTTLSGEDLPEDVLRDVALNRTFTSSTMASKYLALIRIAIIDATTTTSTTSTTVG
jgi:protein phosphatase